jgi:integrase
MRPPSTAYGTLTARLIADGWDIEEVSARLGHANIATTQRIYVHAYDAARRSSGRRDRLGNMYGDASIGAF